MTTPEEANSRMLSQWIELLEWLEKKYAQESQIIREYKQHCLEYRVPEPAEIRVAYIRLDTYYRVKQQIKAIQERNR
ncbi:hypothetical protein [Corynebacterium propinquum]|uniref:hypothetical protein n=1 Tax=Corynebacterium propinquum TaxID=43769 RepID=UPI00119E206C|nr:hypothetical protein [Corynebacterium propinquum]